MEEGTLKEWREYRGMSRRELAEATGHPEALIERWEEIGWDWERWTWWGDTYGQDVLRSVFDALDITGSLSHPCTPPAPSPGQWVVDPAALPEDLRERLAGNAEEFGLRVALDSYWGPYLKSFGDLGPEDRRAIAEHAEREAEHNKRMARFFEDVGARMEEHGESSDDRVEDVFEVRDDKLVPKENDNVDEPEAEAEGDNRG